MKRLLAPAGILLPVLLTVLFLLPTSAAGLADASDYDLYVGGVAVTADNAADILGDGKVAFDPVSNILTLDNADISGYVSTSEAASKYLLSIYSSSERAISVVIRGECRLKHGVRLRVGDVTLQNASVTVSSDAMTAFALFDGDLKIENSVLYASCRTNALTRSVALIYVQNLSMNKGGIRITGNESAEPVDAMVYAAKDISMTDSHLEIRTGIPASQWGIYAGGNMTVRNGTVLLSGQMYSLYVPEGTLTVEQSAIREENCFFAADLAALSMSESEFDAEVFYDGISVVSNRKTQIDEENYRVDPTEALISDSTLKVKMLGYKKLTTLLESLWNGMDAEARAEYGNYQGFLSAFSSGFEQDTAFSEGFSGFCTAVSVLSSEIRLSGFTVGFYATGESSLSISDGSDVRLAGTKAACMLFSRSNSALTLGENLKTAGQELYVATLTDDLAVLGDYLYTFSKNTPTYHSGADYTEGKPTELWNSISGVSRTTRIRDRVNPWLIVLLVFVSLETVSAGAVVTLTVVRRRARKGKSNRKTPVKSRR